MELIFRYLVFHGGSGSEKHEIKTAVDSGVVKMNVDTGNTNGYLILHITDFSHRHTMGVPYRHPRLCHLSESFLILVDEFLVNRTSSRRNTTTSKPKSAILRVLTSLTRRCISSSSYRLQHSLNHSLK